LQRDRAQQSSFLRSFVPATKATMPLIWVCTNIHLPSQIKQDLSQALTELLCREAKVIALRCRARDPPTTGRALAGS
jgi:hypothetical protein